MSSCFLCDTSFNLTGSNYYDVAVPPNGYLQPIYMKFMPIIVGSTGTDVDDQQHENNNKQNYVSYRVKKIEFRSSVYQKSNADPKYYPFQTNYILIFKVPFRNPVFEYRFGFLQNFMLYSEPESVLKYGVYKFPKHSDVVKTLVPEKHDLIVDKPFIVGPNDYVGVLYFFIKPCLINSSAKVWFDIV